MAEEASHTVGARILCVERMEFTSHKVRSETIPPGNFALWTASAEPHFKTAAFPLDPLWVGTVGPEHGAPGTAEAQSGVETVGVGDGAAIAGTRKQSWWSPGPKGKWQTLHLSRF